MDEYNTDMIGRSFYLEPDPPIGRFSKAFFLPLVREFVARRKSLLGDDRVRQMKVSFFEVAIFVVAPVEQLRPSRAGVSAAPVRSREQLGS